MGAAFKATERWSRLTSKYIHYIIDVLTHSPIHSNKLVGTHHSRQNRYSNQSRQEENQSNDWWGALGVGLEDVIYSRLLSVSLHSVRCGRRTGIAGDGELEGEVAIGVGSSE